MRTSASFVYAARVRRGAGALAAGTCLALAGALLQGCGERGQMSPVQIANGDPEAGRRVIGQIGCGVCHVIPGVRSARGTVGPTLQHFARRTYIGGTVPNEPETLVRWVQDAPSLAPGTAMPRMPLSHEQARHVVAYLYTLR
jgi:cytochrome c1